MKKYPTGMCTLKQVIFNFSFALFMIATIITIPLVIMLVLKAELWVTLLTVLGLTLGLSLIYVIVNGILNPLPKMLTKFAFDLNYDHFDRKINLLLKENINDDTKNYILLLKCNILSAINLKESLKLFEIIEEPKYKTYKNLYDLVQIYYFMNKGNEEKTRELFAEFTKKYPKYKNIDGIKVAIEIIFTNKAVEDVEKRVPTNQYALFDNLANANLLLSYYQKQNNEEKALFFAKMILEKETCLNEFNRNAKEFIDKYEKTNVVKESI